MKTLIIIACASLLFVACASSVFGKGMDKLLVSVRLTTGERSRDSNSKTTSITVRGNAIELKQTYGGRRRNTPPLLKKFKLSPGAKRNLLKLIRSNNLLVTDSLELPREGSNIRYFLISVDLTMNNEKGMISISGLRTDVKVKEEKLYQNTLTLVKELYLIMNAQDETVDFEELVREPIKR